MNEKANLLQPTVLQFGENECHKNIPGHKLNKCFNKNTVKATYCTLNNMKERITNNNTKILRKNEKEERTS